MKDLVERFAEELLSSGALRFGRFRLRSGRESPYYIDLRLAVSRPGLLRVSTDLLHAVIEGISPAPTKACGIPMTGALLASSLAALKGVPGAYIRKEPSIYREALERLSKALPGDCLSRASEILRPSRGKGHGIPRLVDGEILEGDRIVLVDDVITTGGSKLEALEILEEELRIRGVRAEILGVAVLVDRQEGGSEELEKRGVRVYRGAGVLEIVEALSRRGLISGEQERAVRRYLEGAGGFEGQA